MEIIGEPTVPDTPSLQALRWAASMTPIMAEAYALPMYSPTNAQAASVDATATQPTIAAVQTNEASMAAVESSNM